MIFSLHCYYASLCFEATSSSHHRLLVVSFATRGSHVTEVTSQFVTSLTEDNAGAVTPLRDATWGSWRHRHARRTDLKCVLVFSQFRVSGGLKQIYIALDDKISYNPPVKILTLREILVIGNYRCRVNKVPSKKQSKTKKQPQHNANQCGLCEAYTSAASNCILPSKHSLNGDTVQNSATLQLEK